MAECTCGETFRDGEDYRDHLPCPGTKDQQTIKELKREIFDLKRIVEHADLLVETANTVALYQPASHAKTKNEAKAWGRFYSAIYAYEKKEAKDLRPGDKAFAHAINLLANEITLRQIVETDMVKKIEGLEEQISLLKGELERKK